jgi:hypothetical protein
MFHLFDKVYLDFDYAISAAVNRVVISQANAPEDGQMGNPQQYAHGYRVADLIGPNKLYSSEIDFFQKIKNIADGNKTVIYCDRTAFQHLFIAWHKLLLNVSTSENLWNIWKQFVDKTAFQSSLVEIPNYVFFDSVNVESWNRAEFDSLFDSIIISKNSSWNTSILNNVGIEYLLSSYVNNGSTQVKSALKDKIKILAKRVLKGEIYDAKINAMCNAFNKSFLDMLSITTPNKINDIFLTPALSVLNDSTLWQSNGKLKPSNNNDALNIELVTGATIPQLIAAFKFIRQDYQQSLPTSPFIKKIEWLNWVNSELSDQQLDDLLMDPTFTAAEIVDESDRNNVNILFIDWVLGHYRANTVSTISDLSISAQ